MDAELPSRPPVGFIASTTRGPFSTRNGPYFHKVESGGRFWHGVRIQNRHCNAHGSLHGGMMSAFADGLLTTAVSRQTKRRGITVRMVCDLIEAVVVGTWLDGTAWVTGQEGKMAYAEAEAFADGNIVFTASGVFKTFER